MAAAKSDAASALTLYPVRLPAAMIARVDALAEIMSADPVLSSFYGGRVSGSAVFRVALAKGLEELEARRDNLRGLLLERPSVAPEPAALADLVPPKVKRKAKQAKQGKTC